MSCVLVRLVRKQGGEAAVAELIARAASPTHDVAFLENIENWISLDEACALLAAGAEITGEENFARQVGAQMLYQHAGTQVATLMRSLGSPEAIFKAVAQASSKVSTVTVMTAIEAAPGEAVVSAEAREGFTRRRLHCDWTTGLLSGPPVLFGLPSARVEESECQARGDARCLYTVTWDAEQAAAEPGERITALEAQLVAMSERLQSAYATAGDLISTEDLDAVLHRIVERAADAVRAPGYILAVQTGADAELQVYAHGIGWPEAQALARATIDHQPAVDGSMLIVSVSSSRRDYGKLIARYPGAIEFSPQEHEILSLYARHAAAVLDMATALDESARRHDQVSSLLALSRALAQAGTSEEVAERLAVAVPEVVDCDGMAVWLWEDEHERLRSLASWARRPDQAARLRGLTVTQDDTPHLARMIGELGPQFFTADTDDRFLGALMAELELAALAVVPIVARDVFRGALTVSVSSKPDRLRSDSELLQRLTGVAALAAPAMENGRLVDKLHHRASHDGLTGLLNRVGFREHIDGVMARAEGGGGQVGLLFIDLNDFKRINDTYHHDAGDELIRQAAERLSSIARAEDQVARLGGDEFAIVLSDVHEDAQVRAAEERVRAAFREPFELGEASVALGASVGGGVWPADGRTTTELVRYADAAMYRDKARARRVRARRDEHAAQRV
ncbi:MAG TPA: diguanylate cyclase [Solirubrobacteraceae bacterium]|nr:diguanylate cyclase [Solirubrobacteraceae bacterium]